MPQSDLSPAVYVRSTTPTGNCSFILILARWHDPPKGSRWLPRRDRHCGYLDPEVETHMSKVIRDVSPLNPELSILQINTSNKVVFIASDELLGF